MSIAKRKRYATHLVVLAAGEAAYQAVRNTWMDVNNPTSEEKVAAKNARLQAKIDAAQALVDSE
jgi:hypothetical protein